MTWENSSLRSWLNSDFIDETFTKGEQKKILITNLRTELNGWLSSGFTTTDKVFLLSEDDVDTYLDIDKNHLTYHQCRPTLYAVEKGLPVSGDYFCSWWLRNSNSEGSKFSCIYTTGFTSKDETMEFNAIRPALWIELI